MPQIAVVQQWARLCSRILGNAKIVDIQSLAVESLPFPTALGLGHGGLAVMPLDGFLAPEP
jgi:hypothetical protein